jgi:hypothetical protein
MIIDIHGMCSLNNMEHLRRGDHRRQGKVGREGIVRYGHQGGGQRQAGQGTVS